MRRYKLTLTEAQVAELTQARDHHRKAYLRERAAAILKVGGGQPIKQVAQAGLLKRRKPQAVKEWVTRYLSEGLPGLTIRQGRGRKPAFFPSEPGRGASSG